MNLELRTVDLVKLNSLTKYPSIPTYHSLDPDTGHLQGQPIPFVGPVLATEKIDGTNARITCLPDGGYLLGSREEWLYAKGDLIGNPALGIVEGLKAYAEKLSVPLDPGTVVTYYLELYGGKITAASKQYTGRQTVGYRLIDVTHITTAEELLQRPPAELAKWREDGGQTFLDEEALQIAAEAHGLKTTPRLTSFEGKALPLGIQEMYELLKLTLSRTRGALDETAGGRPEGIVIRTPDRSEIAKIRYQDYERTLKVRK